MIVASFAYVRSNVTITQRGTALAITSRLNNPTSGKQDVEEHFICPIKAATFFAKETFKAIGRQLRWQRFEPDNTCILRLMGLHKEIIYQEVY